MKVGLWDIDLSARRKPKKVFPNLALMKLSAYFRMCGHETKLIVEKTDEEFHRVYASKVFDDTITPPPQWRPVSYHPIERGGTGWSVPAFRDLRLPPEVEHIYPDYSLYGITDTAYGFMSRGCPRGCPFCIVAGKEGREARKVANLNEFWRFQDNIVLMDPNVLACKDRNDILRQLAFSRSLVDINQGADIRFVNEDVVSRLNDIKLKDIHFAWDNANDDLSKQFELYAKLARRKYHGAWATVYVLVNYNSTMEQNLYRINTLRGLGYDPYVMVYDKPNAPREIRRLQRWCNNRIIFKSCNWEDYK